MLRRSLLARALWVLAIALLLVRVGESHLHLCLDGQEPAVALHVDDAPEHGGVDASLSSHNLSGHNDRDIDTSNLPWAKKVGMDELPAVLLTVLILTLLLPAVRNVPPLSRLLIPAIARPASLLPPLRGPPL